MRRFQNLTLSLLLWWAFPFCSVAQQRTNQESQFLARTRQLTYDGKRSGEGYFSADGKAMVFQSEREPDNPFYQIYVLDLESGDTTRVSPGYGKTTCAFLRPNSDEVLFASTHLDPPAKEKEKAELDFRASGKQRRYSWDDDDTMDIFVAKRDGSNIRRLTEAKGYDAEGCYSPDGKLIVFCSLRDAFEHGIQPRLGYDAYTFGLEQELDQFAQEACRKVSGEDSAPHRRWKLIATE
jgi:Tol biopolymer transport system component